MDTLRNDEFLEEIKKRLSKYRFIHSINVADEAKRLALKYGADPEKAYTAGLIHDIAKDLPKDEQLKMLADSGTKLSDVERQSPKVWHAMCGELILRNELNVTDEEILSAVRYHTTAKAGMSLLEKVLYIADYTSAERDYPDVDVMREKTERSLEEAMQYGLEFTIHELINEHRPVHPDSINAYNEVAMLLDNKRRK